MLQTVTVTRQLKWAPDGITTTVLNPGATVNMGKRIAAGLRDEGFVTYEDREAKQAAPHANKQMPPVENKDGAPGTLVSAVIVPKNWKRLGLDQKKALALRLGAPADISEDKIDAGLAAVYAGQVEKAKEAAEAAERDAREISAAWDEAEAEDLERFPPKGE